jgi:hypothetical protein
MEKLSSIFYTSALETYDLLEKNKTNIVKLITMFLPKETRDFILIKEFDYNTYYSKSELESIAMDIENQTNQSTQQNEQNIKNKIKKKRKGKNSRKQSIGLSNSINKSKLRFLTQYIPESLLDFLIFFSYLSLHSIYFWSIFIIVVFVSNINYLLIVLFIVIINTYGMVLFSACPINIIERKYRNKLTHNQFFLCNIIKKIYDDHKYYDYEENIERFVFAIFALFIKINSIILYKVFIRGLFNP